MALREDAKIELSPEQRAELEKAARSRRTAQAVAQRARIVLLTAEGLSPSVIGEQLGVSQPTIRKWRARYQECGLAGLRTEARPGRLKWTHLSRQISSGFKLNPLLLLQPNGAAPMRPGWKDFRPGQSD
ncbi:helix-turn-helix domain-containing protein [Alcaligenaceae bacterium]|nr:helix-turn-helix domain-containing protein [Alcaligenaceae bacterium]